MKYETQPDVWFLTEVGVQFIWMVPGSPEHLAFIKAFMESNMAQSQFTLMCDAIQDQMSEFTKRISEDQPPLAVFHTILDGKEFLISIIPSDLAGEEELERLETPA